MDNPTFIDEENIPLVHQNEDYDDYRTPNTSRIDETLFTVPNTQEEATSTLSLRQKLKRDKIVSLYRYLDVTGDPGLVSVGCYVPPVQGFVRSNFLIEMWFWNDFDEKNPWWQFFGKWVWPSRDHQICTVSEKFFFRFSKIICWSR